MTSWGHYLPSKTAIARGREIPTHEQQKVASGTRPGSPCRLAERYSSNAPEVVQRFRRTSNKPLPMELVRGLPAALRKGTLQKLQSLCRDFDARATNRCQCNSSGVYLRPCGKVLFKSSRVCAEISTHKQQTVANVRRLPAALRKGILRKLQRLCRDFHSRAHAFLESKNIWNLHDTSKHGLEKMQEKPRDQALMLKISNISLYKR